MELKKNPDSDVHRMSGMFLAAGLVVSLGLVIAAFEYRVYEERVEVDELMMMPRSEEEQLEIPVTTVPPPPPPQVQQPEVIEVPDEEEIEEVEVKLDVELDEDVAVTPEVMSVPAVTGAPTAVQEEVDEIFLVVEDQPEPEGGMQAFYQYLAKNIRYPEQARRMGIEGRVFVNFVVEKDGSLTEVKITRGIGGGCDEEAVRVLKNAPKWKPGKQRGRPVKVRMTVPVLFKMG